MHIPNRRIFDELELPKLSCPTPELNFACFSLMKLLPARNILDRAENRGELGPGSTICETTSGTFGLALAMLSAARGYNLRLVSDPAVDKMLRSRLEQLGAEVEILTTPDQNGNFQGMRLSRLNQLLQDIPQSYCPAQYHNPDNPAAYAKAVEFLIDRLGSIDCFIAPVGSGGALSGTASILRAVFPNLHVIAVDTPGSVLFGQPDSKRLLRGLGNSVLPSNLDHTVVDDVHWVDPLSAFKATRELHRRFGLFQGPTSGASFLVADWWTRRNPGARILVYMPDDGHRYVDTVYNDSWLDQLGAHYSPAMTPAVTDDPLSLCTSWSCFPWQRRSYSDLLATLQKLAS
jgi:cysteine synthase A